MELKNKAIKKVFCSLTLNAVFKIGNIKVHYKPYVNYSKNVSP